MPLKHPKIEMDDEKVRAFLQRAEKNLDPDDFAFLSVLVGTVSFLGSLVEKKASAIVRLLRLTFGFKTENKERIFKEEKAPGAERSPAKGHGRNGAQRYPGAARVAVPHKDIKAGDRCPECLKGKLYPVDPGMSMRFFATAPIQLTIYLLEKLRCNLCGEVYTAEKPAETGEQKYDETVAAMVAVSKYGGGFPCNRMEKLQENCGVPLAASTQWQLVHGGAQTCKPVYAEMIRQAAQSDIFYQDDTGNRIFSVNKDKGGKGDQDTKQRKGVFTTGIVCESKDRKIACFFTGTSMPARTSRNSSSRGWPSFPSRFRCAMRSPGTCPMRC